MTYSKKYELIFKSYYRALVTFAMSYTSSDEAEDIVQEIFVKMWTNMTFNKLSDTSIKSYLYTSVRNRSIDLIRSKKRNGGERIELSDEKAITNNENIESDAINYEEEMERVEKIRRIYCAIETLPEQCKKIFKKVHLEEKSYLEVAQEMDLSLNTVKVQMYRASVKIRDFIIFIIFNSIILYYL